MSTEISSTASTILEDYHFSPQQLVMKESVRKLTKYQITNDHFARILASWYYYQDLINLSKEVDLKRIKRKVKKFVDLHKELSEILVRDTGLFHRAGIPLSLFNSFDNWIRFERLLNRKRGSPFNKERLTKMAYFELLFHGESLGISPPTKNYEENNLETYLSLLLQPLKIDHKTFEHYYQEYVNAKSGPDIKSRIAHLIQNSSSVCSNIKDWESTFSDFQNNLLPLML
mgnify:CR=1 FL=1